MSNITSQNTLRIVTRTSALALWQANYVRAQLLKHHPELVVEIIGVKTSADQWQDIPLFKMGGKGVFVKELEEALLANTADLAVHSLKDVPFALPEGLGLAAVCERENPLDAWVCPKQLDFAALPSGSRVGTSSLRRIVQLSHMRTDLEYVPLRGNIDTRLRKCQQGEWDAIVLAAAGLTRLELQSNITMTFTPEQVLPAVGQGALGIECRLDDERTRALLSVLEHPPTRACISAERAMNTALGGSCQVPVAGFAIHQGNKLCLTGRVGHPQRGVILESQRSGTSPEMLGELVAADLLEQGAGQIIKEILASTVER
jgi:hydroxymethylbilane synthase